MISGLNTNITYEGKTYHVQTEDGGVGNPVIVTLLYDGGIILATRKRSYADILKDGRLSDVTRQVVKQVMEEQHRRMVDELLSGTYTKEERPKEGKTETKGISKSLDQAILDYLTKKDEKGR